MMFFACRPDARIEVGFILKTVGQKLKHPSLVRPADTGNDKIDKASETNIGASY